jgi:predicted nucleotidyltransferase
MDWDLIEADLPEIPTEKLIEEMEELGLHVNRKIALEIIKREDAVFWLRKLLLDGKYWHEKRE